MREPGIRLSKQDFLGEEEIQREKQKGFPRLWKSASKGIGKEQKFGGWGEMGDLSATQKILGTFPNEGRWGDEGGEEGAGSCSQRQVTTPPSAPWRSLQKQPTWGARRQALASPAPILGLLTNMKLRLKNRPVAKPHPLVLFFQGPSPPNSLQSGSHFSALLEAGVLPLWGDGPASNPPPGWQLRETAGPLSGPDPAEGPTGLSLLSVNN